MDFDDIAHKISGRVYLRYRDHAEVEDAIQEALIQGWKDFQTGKYDEKYLINRAMNWAKSFLFSNHTATGKPRAESTGIMHAHIPALREKIGAWEAEYYALHGYKPTNKEVSAGTGIAIWTVSTQRKRMREDNQIKPLTKVTGSKIRTDKDAYVFTSMDQSNSTGEEMRDFLTAKFATDFESDLLSNMTFVELVSPFDEQTRFILYHYFVEQWTQRDIGDVLYPGESGRQTKVARTINCALAVIEKNLDGTPLQPAKVELAVQPRKCYLGKHWLSPENTTIGTNGSKRCKQCAKDREKRKRGITNTTKRKCKNGHYLSPENTSKRGDRGRRCKKCAAEWMAAKRKAQKDGSTEG